MDRKGTRKLIISDRKWISISDQIHTSDQIRWTSRSDWTDEQNFPSAIVDETGNGYG